MCGCEADELGVLPIQVSCECERDPACKECAGTGRALRLGSFSDGTPHGNPCPEHDPEGYRRWVRAG